MECHFIFKRTVIPDWSIQVLYSFTNQFAHAQFIGFVGWVIIAFWIGRRLKQGRSPSVYPLGYVSDEA
jgi:hypothetical protein